MATMIIARLLWVLLVALSWNAHMARAIPNASIAIVSDVRVTMLSPTLVRVEQQGPMGFEDRPTFMVVNRSFAGVPITKQFINTTDGSTHLQTTYYTVVLPKKPSSAVMSERETKNDTCTAMHVGMDGGPSSTRINHNPLRGNMSTASCCAACNNETQCTAWVLGGDSKCTDCQCYLLATLAPETASNRVCGGIFTPTPPPTPAPEVIPVQVLALNGSVLFSVDTMNSVNTKLDFPAPYNFSAAVLSWAIRDAPRFVTSKYGAIPINVTKVNIDPALINTSGFDLRNDAEDIYIFLPGAANLATRSSSPAAVTSTSASYGYTELRSEYLALTGPIPSLPNEAFGTWFSWYHAYNQSAAEDDIAHWRRDDLPIDIWGLDMDWRIWKGGEEGKGYFINTTLFPNMSGFYDYAHSMGLSVYMNDHPMAKAEQLSPEEIYFRYQGLTSLFDLGLDFWWYDENWHDIIPGLDFGSGTVDHLVWGQEIYRSVLDYYNAEYGPRNKTKPFKTLTLSMYSSSHPAEHRFPVWWTGDVVYTMLLDNVHKMVDGGLNLQPYVHPDCGAHYGVPYEQETPEMFVRWSQFCAMGTIIRYHTNNCCDHRPWTWGEEAEAAIRSIIKLRYSLMPTLVAAGQRATLDGTPVVQRLDLTWPELSLEGASRNDQYLFGDGAMLVAPIIPFNGSDPVAKNATNGKGNSSRTVWVPPGEWQNAWDSGDVVSGPTNVQVVDCPLDQIPIWHKKGSMLVTTAPAQSTSEQNWTSLSVEVFPFSLLDETTMASPPLRTWTSYLYDTKVDLENPPRTSLVLHQHATTGSCSLKIGGGAVREWRIRVHLLPGETVGERGLLIDGEPAVFSVIRQKQSKATALITPRIDKAVVDESHVDNVVGSVVEVVVHANRAQESSVQFEIVAAA
eukprot:m.65720 g.65720  ORF g.65720 m.65720 type:complete len:903 (-) comp23596_c0_seq1:497-3205(-)